MKFPRLVAAACAASLACALRAQPTPATDAARDWAAVLALTSTPALPVAPARKTRAQVDAERTQQALRLRQAAQAAKEFAAKYPVDKQAPASRKLEAICALQGVIDGDAVHEQAALQTAQVFRTNPAYPLAHRVEVAALAERTQARAKLGGSSTGDSPSELEKIAAKLRTEFGDVDPVFDFYADVARGADMATAKRIATNLNNWPAGPRAKSDAQAILARDALLGKPLVWSLTRADGAPLNLAEQTGKLTVIYAWSSPSTNGLLPLAPFKKTLPANTQVLYLALGGTAAQASASVAAAPIAGVACHENRSVSGPSAAPLRILRAPCVFVLDRTGALSGYGPASELSNLLDAAR